MKHEEFDTIEFIDENSVIAQYECVYIKDGTMHAVSIPSFDIHFSSPNTDDIPRRANIMVKAFFRYWFEKRGREDLIEEIHRLGFVSKRKQIPTESIFNIYYDDIMLNMGYKDAPSTRLTTELALSE